MESLLNKGIYTKSFYGKRNLVQMQNTSGKSHSSSGATGNIPKPLPFRLRGLSGPSRTWKIFKKQSEAIKCAKSRKNGLMVFPFEYNLNSRLFLVAHPKIFWYYDCSRDPKYRCTYELIPEYTVCKLYFDLEFEFRYNPGRDGVRMVNNFIAVVCYFIKKQWNLVCTRESVLDLDSTTEKKFSRHLIFQLQNAVFLDNYNVGAFVKFICSEVRNCILWRGKSAENSEGTNDSEVQCGSADTYSELSKLDLADLVVYDSKGMERLFCDEGVYTKNRHFRLFYSTKYGKNSPLVLSKENVFKPLFVEYDFNETLFHHSLVTFINSNGVNNFKILEFCFNGGLNKTGVQEVAINCVDNAYNVKGKSHFPFIDEFISRLVFPGKIWRSAFFSTTNHLVYDIVGYRFCNNIGREHRRNNIKYVVDMQELCFYQKCYDPDCRDYRSPTVKLPAEISFFLEDDSMFVCSDENVPGSFQIENVFSVEDDVQRNFSFSSQDLNEVLNIIEDISSVDFE